MLAFSVSWFLLRFSRPVERNVFMVGNITRISTLARGTKDVIILIDKVIDDL